MENVKLKIGIIGCGGIANGKHLPALKNLDNVEIVAFCDIIPERAEKARAAYGSADAKTYVDYKELLKDGSIDAVHVCTPNRSHSFITVDALEAGKHVMCEKPMAINSAEAKKMLDAAKRTGKKLTIGYQSRQRADAIYMKNECLAGTFGDIYYAKATAIRRRAVPTWGVFLNEEEQGGGPLIDIGTHALDLTLWMMDNYKPKYCIGKAFHKLNKDTEQGNAWGNWDPDKFTVEDSAFGMIVMENGAVIMLESAWALNTLDVREAVTSICGTKAGADMNDGLRINGIRQNLQYTMKPNFSAAGAAFYDGAKANDMGTLEAAQWVDAIINDRQPCVSPEQAYTVTRILEGIYISSQTGDVYRFD
ncbi:MAG: Gfo/Idh/MocA family oxidoreductase [Ruminococcaceae bacterium]|nr:Gfo/Idh/MocA family oxidoreductase [Oscillospiraceae bacterium]